MRLPVSAPSAAACALLIVAIAPTACLSQVKTSKYPWINTWAVEYYQADGATLQKDVSHFDIHLSPDNVQGVKSLSPRSLAFLYGIWREQYATEEPGAAKERRKIDAWCKVNGKNKESFYCHYGSDVTVRSRNLSTGSLETSVIPGWDPANDVDHDDIRDKPSDHGESTSAGSNSLSDTSKGWTSDQWTGATLVDKSGSTFRVTGNTATTLSLAAGTPANGRYGLSASGSVNHLATARTKRESRARSYIWENYAYAMNLGNPDYQSYRACDARRVITEPDKAWDPSASREWDGFMVDNTSPDFPWAEVVDGKDVIAEYPDRGQWRRDQVELFRVVRSMTGKDKLLIGNTGSYDYPEIAEAGGGQHQEQYVAIVNEHGPVQWDYWKKLSDKRIYSLVLPSWDCWTEENDRERMHYLAFHYMGQQPYIYLGFRGFGYAEVYHLAPTPYLWLPACEVDVGTPVDGLYKLAASGNDPTGQSYKIYTRRYSRALIVCRPKLDWSQQNYSAQTGVLFSLPYYATGTGRSNLYKPLRADGTLEAAVSSITLRHPESYIMMTAESTAASPARAASPERHP